jgi:hypothetical protein
LTLRLRLPAGHDGKSPAVATHIPPADHPGSRPLLQPKHVLYSSSYYLDLAKFWENRDRLFNEKQRKAFEDFDKRSATFLAGSSFSKLVGQAGPYQRLVAVHQATSVYKITPEQRIPAFALVVEMREPESLPKRLDAILRGAAFLAMTQVRLKQFDEMHGGHKIVGYRFPEDGILKQDTTNFRFNFSPCYVTVGNQFAVCSTVELARELVDLLEREAPERAARSSPLAEQTQVYAAGAVQLLESFKDRIFTQVMLNEAVAPDQANEQVRQFLDLVRHLGVLQFSRQYGAHDFCYEIQLKPSK